MEEKLYFKPGNYGKRTKAKKPETPKVVKIKGSHNRSLLKLGLILLILVVAILVVLYFLRGKTTVVNERIPNVKNTSLSCSSDSVVYPIFYYDGAKARELNVKMVFSEDILKSISLDYSLFYDSKDAITGSEAHNHGAMNISFGQVGLKPDDYNAKYTILSDRFRMNLYATEKKLDETAKRYFLVETDGAFPTSITELKQNYESQGLTCKKSE